MDYLSFVTIEIMEHISIENVLVKLGDTVDSENLTVKTYGIRFLSAEGKREVICRKYTRTPKAQVSGQDPKGKHSFHLQLNGVVMLQFDGDDHPKYVYPAMIYGFQDYKSSKWLNVSH
jgi:hypothetical protein